MSRHGGGCVHFLFLMALFSPTVSLGESGWCDAPPTSLWLVLSSWLPVWLLNRPDGRQEGLNPDLMDSDQNVSASSRFSSDLRTSDSRT